HRRAGRTTHQRRRCVVARRMGWLHARRQADRRGRQVRRLCQHAAQCRAQRDVSRRPRASEAVMSALPIGPPVDATPAGKPDAVTLTGRFGRVEKLDAGRHGAALWVALRQHDALWTYMGYGPFADEAAFMAWLEQRPHLADPFSYAIIDVNGSAVGIATL